MPDGTRLIINEIERQAKQKRTRRLATLVTGFVLTIMMLALVYLMPFLLGFRGTTDADRMRLKNAIDSQFSKVTTFFPRADFPCINETVLEPEAARIRGLSDIHDLIAYRMDSTILLAFLQSSCWLPNRTDGERDELRKTLANLIPTRAQIFDAKDLEKERERVRQLESGWTGLPQQVALARGFVLVLYVFLIVFLVRYFIFNELALSFQEGVLVSVKAWPPDRELSWEELSRVIKDAHGLKGSLSAPEKELADALRQVVSTGS